jgi:hypothetical protein
LLIGFFCIQPVLKRHRPGGAIMDNIENIIKEFRQSDFERRLHIFLAYPSLRPQFSDIEDLEAPVMYSDFRKSRYKVFRLSGSFRFILPWASGLLKRCCYHFVNK